MMTKSALKKHLKTLARDSVKAWMIRWICQQVGVTPTDLLRSVTGHGCQSGCVPALIYTNDCLAFYDHFESDIWALVTDFLDSTGESLGDFIDHLRPAVVDLVSLKTTLSWFAVEETAHQLLADDEAQ